MLRTAGGRSQWRCPQKVSFWIHVKHFSGQGLINKAFRCRESAIRGHLAPKIAEPTRTCVAPKAMAIS